MGHEQCVDQKISKLFRVRDATWNAFGSKPRGYFGELISEDLAFQVAKSEGVRLECQVEDNNSR